MIATRGFLANYPSDVVYIVNGQAITRADILENKRRRERRRVEWQRRNWEDVTCPCFIWTFYNPGFIYGGWWLYIKTAKESFRVTFRNDKEMILKIMDLFPCGLLPIIENFDLWKATFAETYHRPIKNRPEQNGMVIAWARLSYNGMLLDVEAAR